MALLGGAPLPPARAGRGSSVVCAPPALFSMGGQTLTNKPNILDWANVMEYIDLELRDIQSLRAVCRGECIRGRGGGALPCGISWKQSQAGSFLGSMPADMEQMRRIARLKT